MKELVAVNDPFTFIVKEGALTRLDLSCLKREALMFNRIAIPTLKRVFFSDNNFYHEHYSIITEIEWLLEQGIVTETLPEPEDDGAREELESFISHRMRVTLNDNETQFSNINFSDINKDEILWAFLMKEGFETRRQSNRLRELNIEAYPILPNSVTIIEPGDAKSKNAVVEIVLNSLPIPNDQTPWEQILEFRSDPDSQRKFLNLKTWLNEMARMTIDPSEVEDKLRSLLSEYQHHMRIHKMKTTLDTLKTIAIAETGLITSGWWAGLGVLPAMVGLVTTLLYSMKQRQIALLETEKGAPGKEVAYIVKSQEVFADR